MMHGPINIRFPDRFSKNPQIQYLIKVHTMEADLLRADMQTFFLNFSNVSKKTLLLHPLILPDTKTGGSFKALGFNGTETCTKNLFSTFF